MGGEEIKILLETFCRALADGDVEQLLNLCSDDIVLGWASFTFIGKEEVKKWAKEFGREFPTSKIITRELNVEEGKAAHRFVIGISMSNGKMGYLPCEAFYDFKNSKIQRARILPYDGRILVKQSDLI